MQEKTKQELQALKTIVRHVLEQHPTARRDDNLLFFAVCERWALAYGIKLRHLPFVHVFAGDLRAHLPRYESVVRLRRMVQREREDLQPAEPAKRGRKKREADFVEYARQKGEFDA